MDERRTGPTSAEGELAALRALASRLLAGEDTSDAARREPQLFVGRLPDDLPVAIPVPSGGVNVVGSVVRDDLDLDDPYIEIVLSTGMLPEQFHETYKELMATAGWSEIEPWLDPHGGFTNRPPGDPVIYCLSERGPALYVTAHERSHAERDASTDVRLRLLTDRRYSPCGPRRSEPQWDSVIPRLVPPPGVRHLGGGGSSGGDSGYSTTVLETEMDLATMNAFYATQLREAGWIRSGGDHSGPQAWSIWTFTDGVDRPWEGLFAALRFPEMPRRHFLQVQVNQAPER
jgi:hypothetical protein